MGTGLAPVAGAERIAAIDSVRGFALLGIFLVNIQAFGQPFGEYLATAPQGKGVGEAAAYYFVKIFCETKFYPLFATLFGFGLMMQAERARERGRSYWGLGLRRYLFLIVLGLLHALLLWYGDILFVYGVCGLIVLALNRAGTIVLACVGSVSLAFGVMLMTGFSLLTGSAPPPAPPPGETAPAQTAVITAPADVSESVTKPDRPAATEPAPEPAPEVSSAPAQSAVGRAARVIADAKGAERTTPVLRLLKELGKGRVQQGPGDPIWRALEREAYKSGSATDRLLFNAFTWTMFLMVCLMGFGWHVLGMMLLGAVLFRVRLFEGSRAQWHRRFVMVGLTVGLPMCAVAAFAGRFLPHGPAAAVYAACSMIFGPLMSLAYLGGITLLVRSGSARAVASGLACVGRLALSNYLLQTLIATTIFYHWGFGLFDETTRVQRLGMVMAIFTCQVLLSVVWLRVFRMGPVEWVWRTVTYLRWPGASDAQ